MGRYTKVVAENRKSRFDFHILETFKAGVVLKGTEVKAIRQGKANLKESFARLEKGELWLYGMHVSPYEQGNRFNQDPLRTRKLLLRQEEIKRLTGRLTSQSLVLVPLKLILDGNWVKVDLALAQAKKGPDKREKLRKKAIEKDIERSVGSLLKGKR